jgi:tetratricopeptide (TPR) repeat protein
MRYTILSFLLSASTAFSQSTDSRVNFKLADSLYEIRNWREAAKAYEVGLKMNDKDGYSWYFLGKSYDALKMYTKATKAYEKSIEFPPPTIPRQFLFVAVAKSHSLNKDSTSALNIISDMVNNGNYGNFIDLDSSAAFKWLHKNPRFISLLKKATTNAYPCLENPRNHEFDFWIGDWDVYITGTGYLAGRQKIEKVSGGCLILENWTEMKYPGEGKSMNFINKSGKWEQVWMGSTGTPVHYYNGEYIDGAMRFEGDNVDNAGNKLLFRLIFYNLSKDSIRQFLEQSKDEGKTWNSYYDYTYKRKKH